jgi:hypothetical protein
MAQIDTYLRPPEEIGARKGRQAEQQLGFIERYSKTLDRPDPESLRGKVWDDILALYGSYRAEGLLPISPRTTYYRLIALYGHSKDQNGKTRLADAVGDVLGSMRRLKILGMDEVSDSKFERRNAGGYDDEADFIETLQWQIRNMRLDRQQGQPRRILVWVEAKGTLPLVETICAAYGIDVMSASGMDGIKPKHTVGEEAAEYGHALIIHLGDLDPSGQHIPSVLQADAGRFARQLGGRLEVERLLLTPETVEELDIVRLGEKANQNDLKSHPDYPYTQAWQLEAVDPHDLRRLLREKIEDSMDMDVYYETLRREEHTREELLTRITL